MNLLAITINHPGITLMTAGVVTLLLWKLILNPCYYGILQLIHRTIPQHLRDPRRAFTQRDIQRAKRACGYRCEGTRWWFFRCRSNENLCGDHHWPHSRGGRTCSDFTHYATLNKKSNNLVILCRRCNGKKTNHIPTWYHTWMIQRRRRKYST